LRRPSLLLKLKNVAEYMNRVRTLYYGYPRSPAELPRWSQEVTNLLGEYKARVLKGI